MRQLETLEEKEEEGAPEELQAEITLERYPPDTAGPCSHCAHAKEGDTRLYLLLTFQYEEITLCPECEGELLQKLLNNYVKRRERLAKGVKAQGFLGELEKPPAPPEEQLPIPKEYDSGLWEQE